MSKFRSRLAASRTSRQTAAKVGAAASTLNQTVPLSQRPIGPADGGDGKPMSAERAAIREANARMLAQMSQAELMETWESAQQTLSSSTLESLAQRGVGARMPSTQGVSQSAAAGGSSRVGVVDVAALTSHEQVATAAAALPAGEQAKLAWTGMMAEGTSDPPQNATDPPLLGQFGSQAVGWLADSSEGGRDPAWEDSAGMRFDLEGALVLQGVAGGGQQYRRELHHHGDEPDSPGYTLRELVGLCRSSVPGQRCIALQAVAGVLRRRREGIVRAYTGAGGGGSGITPSRLPKALVVVVRAGLDDTHLPTVQASVSALLALSVAPLDQAWLRDTSVASGPLGATLPPVCLAPQGQAALPFYHQQDSASSAASAAAQARQLDEEGVSRGGDAPPPGSEPMQLAGRALRDAWAGLAATGTVARLAGMLTFPQLCPAGSTTHHGVLGCLCSAIRAQPSVAHAAVHMRSSTRLGPLKPSLTRAVAEGGAIDGAMHPHSPLALAWHSVTDRSAVQALGSTKQAAAALLPVLQLSVATALSGASAAAAIGDSAVLESLTAWVARAHAITCDSVADAHSPESKAVLAAAAHCLRLWRCVAPHSKAARAAAADMWAPLLQILRLSSEGDEVGTRQLQAAVAWLVAEHFESTVAAAVVLAASPDDGDSDEEGGAGGVARAPKATPQDALGFTNDASTDQLVPFQRWAVHIVAESAAGNATAALLLPAAAAIVTAMLQVPAAAGPSVGAADTTAAAGSAAASWGASHAPPPLHSAALQAAGHTLRLLQRSGTAQSELRTALQVCVGQNLGALLGAAGTDLHVRTACVELITVLTPAASLGMSALAVEVSTLGALVQQCVTAGSAGEGGGAVDRGLALAVAPSSVCTAEHYAATQCTGAALRRLSEMFGLPSVQAQLQDPPAPLLHALQQLPTAFQAAADALAQCIPGQERLAGGMVREFLCHAGTCRALTAALIGGGVSSCVAHALRLPVEGGLQLPPLHTVHSLCAAAGQSLLHLIGPVRGSARGSRLPRVSSARYNTACEQLREARAIAFGRHMAAAGKGEAPAELPLSGHGVLQQGFEGGVVGLPLPLDMHWGAWSLAAAAHAAWIQDSATTPEAQRSDGMVQVARSGKGGTQDGIEVGGVDPSARLDGSMWFLSVLHCVWAYGRALDAQARTSPLHGQGMLALLCLIAVKPQVLAPPRLYSGAAALAGLWATAPPPGEGAPPAGLDSQDEAYWYACGADASLVARNASLPPGGSATGSPPVRLWVWLARYYVLLPAVLSRFAQQGMAQPLASSLTALVFLPGWDVFVSGEHIPEASPQGKGAALPSPPNTPRLRSLPGVNSAGAPSVGSLAWDMLVLKGRLGPVLTQPVLPRHPASGPATSGPQAAQLVLAPALLSPPMSFSSLVTGRLTGRALLDSVCAGLLRAPPTHSEEQEHAVYRWAVHHVSYGLFGPAAVGAGSPALSVGFRCASKHALHSAVLRVAAAMRSQPAAAAFLKDIVSYRTPSAGPVASMGVGTSAVVTGADMVAAAAAASPQRALLQLLALAAEGDSTAAAQLGVAGDDAALGSVRAAADLLQLSSGLFQ